MIEGASLALNLLLSESGGHRWQRIPPTERRGRVHTSTVTVAVFEARQAPAGKHRYPIDDRDIEIIITKGTGAGGQNRNKRETAVIMRHRPSGIQAKAESERTQIDNKRNARAELEARVAAHYAAEFNARHAADRKGQVGSGQRADKIRTYREQDDQVTDHRTGRKARLSDVRAGRLELVAE